MTIKAEHLFMFKFNILFNKVSFLQGKPMPNDWLTGTIQTPNCITSHKGGDILAGDLSWDRIKPLLQLLLSEVAASDYHVSLCLLQTSEAYFKFYSGF